MGASGVRKDRKISVIGLGYVGLPVALAFCRVCDVLAFDIDARRIRELRDGHDRINEASPEQLADSGITFTADHEQLRRANFHIVAVPTPISDAKNPDMGPLVAASRTLGSILEQGDIVVYESTVYPGATEEVCAPILEQESGLTCGQHFHLGYSPERVNPGDREHTFTNIVKIVSAQGQAALEVISDVYRSVVTAGVYQAPSIRVAEAAKIVENTQRDVNIALMNQLALLFDRMAIDTGEVLAAAGTKWNFLRFVPGLVGGHCIGVDPYYLTHRAAQSGYLPDLILAARHINEGVGSHIAQCTIKAMAQNGHSLAQSRVTVLGLTFKENIADTRNTRVIDIVNELRQFNVRVQLNDVHADADEVRVSHQLELIELAALPPAEAVVLAVPHDAYLDQDWDLLRRLLKGEQGVVYDVKGVLDRQRVPPGIRLLRL